MPGEITNHHDKFVKETLTQKEHALSFFREYLPDKLVTKLDWQTLKIEKESFIDQDLQERFSDIIYQVSTKGKPVFIYLLFEHQSTVDCWMPLRFLGYIVRLWELYIKQNSKANKLPLVVPILFYHGKDKWKISIDFKDIIIEPDLAIEYVPQFKYLLRDFSIWSDTEIKGEEILRLFLSLMSKIYSPDFRAEFEKMLPLFAEISRKHTAMGYMATALKYLFESTESLSREEIENKIIQVIDEDRRRDIMTIAEQLRQEGRVEGKKAGIVEGEINAYQKMLKEGLLSKDIANKKIAELRKELKEITSSK